MGTRDLQGLVHGTVLALAVGWLLHVGRGVVVPIVFGVLVLSVVLGMARGLGRLPGLGRVSEAWRVGLALVVIALGLVAVAVLVAGNIERVVAALPALQQALQQLARDVGARFGLAPAADWPAVGDIGFGAHDMPALVGAVLGTVASLGRTLIVVGLYVAFLLIERRWFPGKLARLSADPGQGERVRRTLAEINDRIGTYLALKGLLGLGLGLFTWALLAWLGVPFAPFWGAAALLLNFIPYIGSWLSVLLPAAFVLVHTGDAGTVAGVVVALSLAQFFNGNFLDPYLMGSSLNLSPLVIVASLAAWSALWGVPGAFLAVPLTAALVMVLAGFAGSRPIAVLLSRDGEVGLSE